MGLTEKESFALESFRRDIEQERHQLEHVELEGLEALSVKLKFFAEGDSWFDFPWWLRGNVISELEYIYPSIILNWADNGHELLQIMSGKQKEKMKEVLLHQKFDGILFSAGGNDIVGLDLPTILKRKEAGMSWQDCINDLLWDRRLLQIELAYKDLILIRDLNSIGTPIIVNGYDYALPSGEPVRLLGFPVAGPWLDNVFNKKNITDENDQRLIVKYMIDGFKDMQQRLESENDKYHYVNTPGTLDPTDEHWGDELHPSKVGFMYIAQKFKSTLENIF